MEAPGLTDIHAPPDSLFHWCPRDGARWNNEVFTGHCSTSALIMGRGGTMSFEQDGREAQLLRCELVSRCLRGKIPTRLCAPQ